ncbi:MAG TPA: MerR family transcriptional regulator [Phycisphaerae bacterium]|nr:MerR family transcriptional regulator [Phycisphaerae bacterium]
MDQDRPPSTRCNLSGPQFCQRPMDSRTSKRAADVAAATTASAMMRRAVFGPPSRPSGGIRGVRRIPPKLYRVGELAAYSGVSRQTIHNYSTMGIIREAHWTDGGHRLYHEDVFGRLDQIAEFKAQRKSLEFIREHFAERDGLR